MKKLRKIREVTLGGKKVAVSEATMGFLGRILWYSVFELHVGHDEFLDLLKASNVIKELWPSRTRPVDAFRKAVRARESTEFLVTKDIVETNGEREVIPNSMIVARRIREGEVADIPVLIRAKYEDGDLTFVTKSRSKDILGIVKAIRKDFKFFQKTFDSSDVRIFLNQAVKSVYPIQLKSSGGVYFVPEQYGDLVESLSTVMEVFRASSPGTEFVTLPVIDRHPERATILYQYETQTTRRIKELAERAIEWHKEGKELYPSQWGKIQTEYEYLATQKLQYADILETSMGLVDTELSVLRQALGKLSKNIKVKES